MISTTCDRWVSLAEGQRRAAVGRDALLKLIADGRLSIRRIPGSKPRIRERDLDALIEASTTPASAEPQPCPN